MLSFSSREVSTAWSKNIFCLSECSYKCDRLSTETKSYEFLLVNLEKLDFQYEELSFSKNFLAIPDNWESTAGIKEIIWLKIIMEE